MSHEMPSGLNARGVFLTMFKHGATKEWCFPLIESSQLLGYVQCVVPASRYSSPQFSTLQEPSMRYMMNSMKMYQERRAHLYCM